MTTSLPCTDGQIRNFQYVEAKLVGLGFDPTLLREDQDLVSTDVPEGLNLWDAIKRARMGIIDPPHIKHYTKRSKTINPINVSFSHLLESVKHVAFLPSIETDREDSLHGPMDKLTWAARILHKFLRSNKDEPAKSIFKTKIFGHNLDSFKFNHGYEYVAFDYLEKAADWFAYLKDEQGQIMAIHPSLFCYINKVLISTDE